MASGRNLSNRYSTDRSNVFIVGPRGDYKSIETALDVGIANTPHGGIVELLIEPRPDDEIWSLSYTLPNTHNFIFRSNGVGDTRETRRAGCRLNFITLTFTPYLNIINNTRIYRTVLFDGFILGNDDTATTFEISTGWAATLKDCFINKMNLNLTDTGHDGVCGEFTDTVCFLGLDHCHMNNGVPINIIKNVDVDLTSGCMGAVQITGGDWTNSEITYTNSTESTDAPQRITMENVHGLYEVSAGNTTINIIDLYDESDVKIYNSSIYLAAQQTEATLQLNLFSDAPYTVEFKNTEIHQAEAVPGDESGNWAINLDAADTISGAPIIASQAVIPTDTYHTPKTRAFYEGTGDPNNTVYGVYPMLFLQTDGDPDPVIWQSIDVTVAQAWAQISN